MWALEFIGWFLPLTKQVVSYAPLHRLSDFYQSAGVDRAAKWNSLGEAKKAADSVASADPYRKSGRGVFPILVAKRIRRK